MAAISKCMISIFSMYIFLETKTLNVVVTYVIPRIIHSLIENYKCRLW